MIHTCGDKAAWIEPLPPDDVAVTGQGESEVSLGGRDTPMVTAHLTSVLLPCCENACC